VCAMLVSVGSGSMAQKLLSEPCREMLRVLKGSSAALEVRSRSAGRQQAEEYVHARRAVATSEPERAAFVFVDTAQRACNVVPPR